MCIVWLQVLFKAGEEKFGTDEQTFVTILGNRSAEHLRKGLYAALRVAERTKSCTGTVWCNQFGPFSVFDAYMKMAGYEMEESIKRETSGSLEDLLLAVGMHGCPFFLFFLIVRPLTQRYNDCFPILKWSVPGAFQLILLRPCTMQWRWRAIIFFCSNIGSEVNWMCEIALMQGAGTDDNTLIRVMVSRSEVDMLDIRAAFRRMFACSLHSMIKVLTKTIYSTANTVASEYLSVY